MKINRKRIMIRQITRTLLRTKIKIGTMTHLIRRPIKINVRKMKNNDILTYTTRTRTKPKIKIIYMILLLMPGRKKRLKRR